jgi:hypothetical protein
MQPHTTIVLPGQHHFGQIHDADIADNVYPKENQAAVNPVAHNLVIGTGPYAEALRRFADQHLVTLAAGATCAYLGDERNLREFLVADETARQLRKAGHTVVSFLIDDSMEALNYRQLRVALNKDAKLLERYEHWCGQPIGHLPDPFGCHDSFAGHFEEELLKRLHRLECFPVLVSTAKLYDKGAYAPYVQIVLERYQEILTFLRVHFPGYEPEKLFYPLCPRCHHLQETTMESLNSRTLHFYCHHCHQFSAAPLSQVRGKLNWKLDCAARWVLFKIDAEPFNKSYLEPQTGTFAVAQALSREFFNGDTVFPIHYGQVKMENKLSYQLLQSLPGIVLRKMLSDNPPTDIKLTRELVITNASRHEVLPGLSYLDFIKQLLPMWVLTPHALTPDQRDLVAHGVAFREHFLHEEIRHHLPGRRHFEMQQPAVLAATRTLLLSIIELRQAEHQSDEHLHEAIKQAVGSMKEYKKLALHWIRMVIGQQQGLPAARFLMVLPLDYLKMLEYMLEVHLYLHNLVPVEIDMVKQPIQETVMAPITERRNRSLEVAT